MSQLARTRLFNQNGKITLGWYWAFQSKELKRGQAKPLQFLGRELVVFRGNDGLVRALDAYCPHMGAHLAEGKVEGSSIRCLFHFWKFSEEGKCEEIPCQTAVSGVPDLSTYPVTEAHGLIWIFPVARGRADGVTEVPVPPELQGLSTSSVLGRPFVKECHPNVMMINAIDAQHFNSVHNLPVDLNLEPYTRSNHCIEFLNTTRFPKDNWLRRLLSRLYAGRLTYDLCYWNGSTGSVTLGPDFLHFYIIFALRPTAAGKSEGQTILITRERSGLLGKAVNRFLLFATQIVGNYFAKGDTLIFKTIRFSFRTPIKADSSIIRFIQHLEQQPAIEWGTWEPEASSISAPAQSTESAWSAMQGASL